VGSVTDAGWSPELDFVLDSVRVVLGDGGGLDWLRELVLLVELVLGVGPNVGAVGPADRVVVVEAEPVGVEVPDGSAAAADVPKMPTPASGRTTSTAARRRAGRRGSVTVGFSRSGLRSCPLTVTGAGRGVSRTGRRSRGT
jgi:hypothetical protein